MIRLEISLSQLDTIDDVLDVMPQLPSHYVRGVDMSAVYTLQRIVYNKKLDTDKYLELKSENL